MVITKREVEIIETLSEAMPKLSDFEKGYILGVAESKATKKKSKKKDKQNEEVV